MNLNPHGYALSMSAILPLAWQDFGFASAESPASTLEAVSASNLTYTYSSITTTDIVITFLSSHYIFNLLNFLMEDDTLKDLGEFVITKTRAFHGIESVLNYCFSHTLFYYNEPQEINFFNKWVYGLPFMGILYPLQEEILTKVLIQHYFFKLAHAAVSPIIPEALLPEENSLFYRAFAVFGASTVFALSHYTRSCKGTGCSLRDHKIEYPARNSGKKGGAEHVGTAFVFAVIAGSVYEVIGRIVYPILIHSFVNIRFLYQMKRY